LHSTVLSCPVRLRKAWFFEVWHGMVERGPVLLGQAVLCSLRHSKVRRFMVRSGCAGWATVEWCFVWHGEVRFYCGMVWFGDVLFGVVGRVGYCTVF